jgi:hypothetical protein
MAGESTDRPFKRFLDLLKPEKDLILIIYI